MRRSCSSKNSAGQAGEPGEESAAAEGSKQSRETRERRGRREQEALCAIHRRTGRRVGMEDAAEYSRGCVPLVRSRIGWLASFLLGLVCASAVVRHHEARLREQYSDPRSLQGTPPAAFPPPATAPQRLMPRCSRSAVLHPSGSRPGRQHR